MRLRYVAFAALLATGLARADEPVLMSADWGVAACNAWNSDPVLTEELVTSKWIKNDKGRGYKVMRLHRSDCGDKPTVELRVALVDSKAQCIAGGAVQDAPLDKGADYAMHARTARWVEMGAGDYGPMKAMMFGRLSFSGPYGAAMGNMGPFSNFLLIVGKVPGSTQSCPN
jgi:putative sterol carrier protein